MSADRRPFALPLIVGALASVAILGAGFILAAVAADETRRDVVRGVLRLGISIAACIGPVVRRWIRLRCVRADPAFAGRRRSHARAGHGAVPGRPARRL